MGLRKPPSDASPRSARTQHSAASDDFLSGYDDENQTIVGSLAAPSEARAVVAAVADESGVAAVAESRESLDIEIAVASDHEVTSRRLAHLPLESDREAPGTDRQDGSLPFEETMYGRRPARPAADRVGSLIAGRYRVCGVLGEGGMGTVFEASHVDLRKRVAIKILSGLSAGHDEASARFLREARASSAVESEHIVQVFDVGEDLDAGLYMVMELLKGEDLARRIESCGRLSSEEAAALAVQISRALERAHAAGIVHRDLKPANVFLTTGDDGAVKVKVLDFGIAKIVRDAQGSRGGITRRGTAIGTPQYMSPEQAQGLASVDGSTDVYSLGALLHECLTGAPPYPELESYELTILKIMTEDPPRVSSVVGGVEPALDALIARMMARDPAARPRTFGEVRAALAGIHPGIQARRFAPGDRSGASDAPPPPARTVGGVTVESSDPARSPPLEVSRVSAATHKRLGFAATGAAIGLAAVLTLFLRTNDATAPHGSGPRPEVLPAPAAESKSRGPVTAPLPSALGPEKATPPTVQINDLPLVTPGHDSALRTVQVSDLPRVAPASARTDVRPSASASASAGDGGPRDAPGEAEDVSAALIDAQRALEQGKAQRTITLATDAVARAPGNAEAWLTLGAAQELMGDHEAAHRTYVGCAAKATGERAHECVELAR